MDAGRTIKLTAAAVLATATAFAAMPPAQATTQTTTYLVLYKSNSSPSTAASAVREAGGTLVANYREIGVAVVRTKSAGFASNLGRDTTVEGITATARYATKVRDLDSGDDSTAGGDLANSPATDNDTLSGLQWDMRQIKAPEAHAITGGSRSVLVGNIDTGLDFTHPDIAPNYDAANSTDCSSGAPATLQAGNDVNGHGTHTAGTIAAAANRRGIVGVAPNVRIAGIKSSNDDGYFFPEMVVCSFMWAATHDIDVTNNSYFADPWLFNCRNDAEQRAIWKAEQRAIRYAMSKGTTVVASEGNESTDLSHPRADIISPDFPPGSEQEREVTNACLVVPVEIPGVIGVTSAGNAQQSNGGYLKSFYSSYGVSTADVVAPGGDSVYGKTAAAPNGRVLSTYPADAFCRPNRTVIDNGAKYCYLQGTSMAGPHVAGLAALVVSVHGSSGSPNGTMSPGAVAAKIAQTADPQPCPDVLPLGYLESWPQSDGSPQECQGGAGHNSWYGSGQINALTAVTP